MIDKFIRRLYLTCLFIALMGILFRIGLSYSEIVMTITVGFILLRTFVLMYEAEKKDKRKNSDKLHDANFVAGVDWGFDSSSGAIITEVDRDGHIDIVHESYCSDEQLEMRNRRK